MRYPLPRRAAPLLLLMAAALLPSCEKSAATDLYTRCSSGHSSAASSGDVYTSTREAPDCR